MAQLTLSQLESHLGKAAWFLKGPVDAQNELLSENIERIHGWYRDFRDVEGRAHVVTLDEIAANDHNLNIPRYLEPKVEQEMLTVEEAMKRQCGGGICGGGEAGGNL